MPCSTLFAPIAIPDPGRLEVNLTLPALASGSQLEAVQIGWAHPWTQDLTVSMRPAGESSWQTLWSGLGGPAGGGDVTLQDVSAASRLRTHD